MKYTRINKEHINYFSKEIGAKNILIGSKCHQYASDHTENLNFVPEIVVFPNSTKDVSVISKYCNNHNIPVTPSASLTGLSGGALPVFGGVSLSMNKMNNPLLFEKPWSSF